MTPIVFDIESVPNQTEGLLEQLINEVDPPKLEVIEPQNKPDTIAKKEERNRIAIAEWESNRIDIANQKWLDTAKKFTSAEIYCVSFAVGDNEVRNIWPGSAERGMDERYVLETFFREVSSELSKVDPGMSAVVVGHNVLGFDCPLLQVRSIKHGIPMPLWWPVLDKPYHNRIIDTLPMFLAGNKSAPVAGHGKMDYICEFLDIPLKGSEFDDDILTLINGDQLPAREIDGSKVWSLVESGFGGYVAHYCGGDVERTRMMFNKMNAALGVLKISSASQSRQEQYTPIEESIDF